MTRISEDMGAGGTPSGAGGSVHEGTGGVAVHPDCGSLDVVRCGSTPGCGPVPANIVDVARQCSERFVTVCVPTTCKSRGPVALIGPEGACVSFGPTCLPTNWRLASPANGPLGCGVVDVPCISMPPREPDPDPPAPCVAIAFHFDFRPIDGGVGCAGKLPAPSEDETLDPRKMNLSYRDGMTSQTLVYVSSEAGCSTELGYYYDDKTNPMEIIGCPRTCAAARSPSPYVSFNLELGCPVKIPVP